MARKTLTVKQQRFVDFYDGNATDAARKAGYKNPEISAKENIRKHTIIQALQNREKKRNGNKIATREERQEFWTKAMKGLIKTNGEEPRLSDMLKASELLGRSEADFTDKHIVTPLDTSKMTKDQVESEIDKLRSEV